MILQFYLTFLWSEKPMSPGREEPTAGADVLAAQRGSVVCSWARLSVCTGNITSSIFWFLNSSVKSNPFFVWNINTFDGLNHHSDQSHFVLVGDSEILTGSCPIDRAGHFGVDLKNSSGWRESGARGGRFGHSMSVDANKNGLVNKTEFFDFNFNQ